MRTKLFWWALLISAAVGGGANAHPHVWIDVSADVRVDDQGRVIAVAMSWRFDDIYSLYAVDGFDADGDGTYTAEELRPMAADNVANLQEWRYFLDARIDDSQVAFAEVTDYGAGFENDRLTLHITVPFAEPVEASEAAPLTLRVYDPSFYISLALASETPVGFSPSGPCRAEVTPAPGMDESFLLTENLFEQEVEPGTEGIGAAFADTITITCGGAS